MSIVQPDTAVRIVLFGWWLDEVMLVGFTTSDSCGDTIQNVSQVDFTVHTEKRLVVDYSFAAPDKAGAVYRICLKQKPRETKTGEVIELPFVLVSVRSSGRRADGRPAHLRVHRPAAPQVLLPVRDPDRDRRLPPRALRTLLRSQLGSYGTHAAGIAAHLKVRYVGGLVSATV